MPMNKNEYSGLIGVFQFSFMQNIKSKMNIVVTCILCVIAILSVPLMGIINGHNKSEDGKKSEIQNVLVHDETELGFIDGLRNIDDKKYSSIKYSEDKRSSDEVKKLEGKNDVYLNISFDESKGFLLFLIYDTKGKVDKNMAESYTGYIQENFNEISADITGIDEDTQLYLKKEIGTEVHVAGEKPENGNNGMSNNLILAVAFLVTFIFALMGESIATSIATEKSTRVIEYLMVTIRPMALITGKVLASLSVFILQIICVSVSFGVSELVFGNHDTDKIISEYFASEMIKGISFVNILFAIIILLEGFLLFGIFAGLAGAAVSRIENVGESMKFYSILLIAGAYATMFTSMAGKEYTFLYLFPITSPFSTPAYLILGRVSVPIAVAAVIILGLCIFLMFKFVASVYEGMIFYNGKTLGIKDIIHLAGKNSSHEVKGEEN